MTKLELILIGFFITSLFFLLVTISLLTFYFIKGKRIKQLNIIKSKSKNKRKKIKKEIRSISKSRKKIGFMCLVSLFLTICLGAGTAYVSYYQSVNLSVADQKAVVKGYYLLTDLSQQLENIKSGELEEHDSISNTQMLGSSMASFNHLKASTTNKIDGQVKLNRYYTSLKELGVNTIAKSQNFYDNPKLIDEFLMDVDKTINHQKEVFDYYKVDEAKLEKSK